jgi:DNA/RNA-binding domain of Phe-tRNA-synthetase-like protein
MPDPFVPRISPEVFALRPDFTALALLVRQARNAESDETSRALLDAACAAPCAEDWAEAHLAAWRDAFQAFGAKPKRTPSSAEALRRRAERDGRLPTATAVVDLYNALSLRHAVPIGGEDADGYVGLPELRRAAGTESFDTMADGAPKLETVDAGEVVWCDDAGVTCRRWNWRQGVRTRITEGSTAMWFVLERLDPMPVEALLLAGRELVAGLRRLSPGLTAEAGLLSAGEAWRPVDLG